MIAIPIPSAVDSERLFNRTQSVMHVCLSKSKNVITRPPNNGNILIPTDSMYAGRLNKLGLVY